MRLLLGNQSSYPLSPAVQRCEGFGSIFLKEEGVQNSAQTDWTSLEGVSMSYCEEVCLDADGQVVIMYEARKRIPVTGTLILHSTYMFG